MSVQIMIIGYESNVVAHQILVWFYYLVRIQKVEIVALSQLLNLEYCL